MVLLGDINSSHLPGRSHSSGEAKHHGPILAYPFLLLKTQNQTPILGGSIWSTPKIT